MNYLKIVKKINESIEGIYDPNYNVYCSLETNGEEYIINLVIDDSILQLYSTVHDRAYGFKEDVYYHCLGSLQKIIKLLNNINKKFKQSYHE